MSDVSVVIPNWNGAALLADLFQQLEEQTHAIREVILVDNGSSDGSREVAGVAGARVLALGRNAGFAAAVNRGIQAANSEWLLLLNNDVELPSSWLATMVERLEAAGAWFGTGKLLDARRRDRLDGTSDAICRGATAWRCGAARLDGPAWSQEKPIHFAPFTCLLARRELFEKAGLLDETFESYLEDVDFGLRCAELGISGRYVPDAVAYHRGSATLGRWNADTVRRIARNQVFLVAKYYPRNWLLRYGWPVLVAQALWALVALRHGAGWAYLRGKLEGVRRFRSLRRFGGSEIPRILAESECDILTLQRQTGFDWYWRLYFAVT